MLEISWWAWLALGLGGAFLFSCLILLAIVGQVLEAVIKITAMTHGKSDSKEDPSIRGGG